MFVFFEKRGTNANISQTVVGIACELAKAKQQTSGKRFLPSGGQEGQSERPHVEERPEDDDGSQQVPGEPEGPYGEAG